MTSDKMNYHKMELEMWQTKVESEAVKNKAFQAHTHAEKWALTIAQRLTYISDFINRRPIRSDPWAYSIESMRTAIG